MINVLNEFKITTRILLQALRVGDLEKAHEAVSVLLLQGMTMLGRDHPAMQQFFPVWNAIETYINSEKLDRALGQAETWSRQLDEIIEILQAERR